MVNQALKTLCGKEDPEILSCLLRHPQEAVREAALESLASKENPLKFFSLLLPLLNEPELYHWASEQIAKILEEPWLWFDPDITPEEIREVFNEAIQKIPQA